MKTKTLKNQHGMGIVQVLVATGLSIIVALSVMTLITSLNIKQNNVKFRSDADVLNEEIRALLSSPQACSNTFAGLVATSGSSHAITQIKNDDTPAVPLYLLNKVYGDNSVKVLSMTLRNFAPGPNPRSARMTLISELATFKKASGAQTLTRSINLKLDLNTATNQITSCIALAKMSDGIWQISTVGPVNHIFYNPPPTGGNVGIGTHLPNSTFHVVVPDVNGAIEFQRGDRSLYIDPNDAAANLITQIKTGTAMALQFQVDTTGGAGGTTALHLAPNGNAGFGTSSPIAKIHIAHGSLHINDFGHKDSPAVQIGDTNSGFYRMASLGGGVALSIHGQEKIYFTKDGAMQLLDKGNPNEPTLRVADSNTGLFRPSGSTGGLGFTIHSNERMRITESGRVGIGVANPTYQLELSTDSAAKPGTSTWDIVSDERLKDIHGPFLRGLDAINSIEPIYFNYKEGNPLNLPANKNYVGIRAQDALKSIPEAVSKDDKGYYHLSNDSIIWSILNAVKELYAKWISDSREIHRALAEKADKGALEQILLDNQKLRRDVEELKIENARMKDQIERLGSAAK